MSTYRPAILHSETGSGKRITFPYWLSDFYDKSRRATKVAIAADPTKKALLILPEDEAPPGIDLFRINLRSIDISLNRLYVPMPTGLYQPVAPRIFQHESMLDQSVEANAARTLLVTTDFKAKFPYYTSCLKAIKAVRRGPEGYLCPRCGNRPRQFGAVYGKWAGLSCPICGQSHYPQDGTVFAHTKKGLLRDFEVLWYMVHHPAADSKEVEQALKLPHKTAWDAVRKLRPFVPPLTTPEDFDFHFYRRLLRSAKDKYYFRVMPLAIKLTVSAWEKLGKPERVDISFDPILASVKVRPNPEGLHKLNRSGNKGGGYNATIRNIGEYMPLGVYEAKTIGKFEGIFEKETIR